MARMGWREVREGIHEGKAESVARVVLAYLERCEPARPERRWRPLFTALVLGVPASDELLAAAKRALQEADGSLTLAQYAEAVLCDPNLDAHLEGETKDGA